MGELHNELGKSVPEATKHIQKASDAMRFGIYLPEDKKPIFTLRGTDDTPRAEIEKIAISIEGPKIHFGMEDEGSNWL